MPDRHHSFMEKWTSMFASVFLYAFTLVLLIFLKHLLVITGKDLDWDQEILQL